MEDLKSCIVQSWNNITYEEPKLLKLRQTKMNKSLTVSQ